MIKKIILMLIVCMCSSNTFAQTCTYTFTDELGNPVTGLGFDATVYQPTSDPDLLLMEVYTGAVISEVNPGEYEIEVPDAEWLAGNQYTFQGHAFNYGCALGQVQMGAAWGCGENFLYQQMPTPGERCKRKNTFTRFTTTYGTGYSQPIMNPPPPGASAAAQQAFDDSLAKAAQQILNILTAGDENGTLDGKKLCTGPCPGTQECRPTGIEAMGVNPGDNCWAKTWVNTAGTKGGYASGADNSSGLPGVTCDVRASECKCVNKTW